MSAAKGNQFWKQRTPHGRKPKFASPDELWDACEQYFEWVETNPLYRRKAFTYRGAVTVIDIPKMRAMTLSGLCRHLDISLPTWLNYKKREGFLDIITRAESIIWVQKFEGAAASMLNANIIARELGLADNGVKKNATSHLVIYSLRS